MPSDLMDEQADLIRDLYNHAPCGYHSLDKEGTFVQVNDTELNWLGYTRDELIGRVKIRDLLAPGSVKLFDEFFPRLKTEGIVRDVEAEFVRKDGTILPVMLTATAITDSSGRYLMSRSMMYDMTDRKREQATRLRLASIVESSDDAIIGETLDRVIRDWNAGAEAMFGYTAEEVRGKSFSILFPTSGNEFEALRAKIRRGEAIRHFETICLRKDGEQICVSLTMSPIVDASGTLLGVSTIARDITTSKRSEEELWQSEKRFRDLLQAAPDAIMEVDTQGRIVMLNHAAEVVFGYSREELFGLKIEELVPEGMRGDHRQHRSTYMKNPKARPMGIGLELKARRKDGTLIPVEISLSPNWSGGALNVIVIVRDIRERKRTEELLRRSEEKFRQTQKLEALGRLAGGIAHEFNNLLTMVLGYADLLVPGVAANEQLNGYVQKIRMAGRRAASLTRQLLVFGRRQVLMSQVLDLNGLLAQVCKMLARVIGEHIQTVFIPALEPAWVRADPGQIDQIIVNLATNARDAMPQGGKLSITVSNVEFNDETVQQHPGLLPGKYVLMSVSDTGEGMAAEVQAHIFEPFFTTREVGKGTGLGLAEVYGMVNQSGGTIAVQSQVGAGSTFEIYLPRAADEDIGSVSSTRTSEQAMHGSETILLVEDEPQLMVLCRDFLQKLGYTTLDATHPKEALQIARQFDKKIDLLLTDIVMPGMNGRKLAAQIKGYRPNIRVLYISGHADHMIDSPTLPDRESHFLEKPFALDELALKLRRVLIAE
jgi:PAS domain S-box-containing protein